MKRKKRGLLTMFTGLLLIAAALFLTGYNIWEQKQADEAASSVLQTLTASMERTGDPEPAKQPDQNPLPEEEALLEAVPPPFVQHPDMQMPQTEIEGNRYIGVLEIPALNLALPIMGDWTYEQLKIAPCRYTGSVYSGDAVICGHNYDRHFGSLKDLSIGEEIRFTDMDGNVFVYSLCAQQSLHKTAVSEMIAQSGDWDLTLFTCTPGGQTRATVRCKLESYQWNRPQ